MSIVVRERRLAVVAAAWLWTLAGCSPPAEFGQNAAYYLRQELTINETFSPDRKTEFAAALAGLFGTPDEPHVPAVGELDWSGLLDEGKLEFAGGPVGRDATGRARGLYREHCAHCHGVTGDGAGPTAAFLNPYPRDYRKGVYKFKSTPKGIKPTHDDLRRILVNGIPGTAMPSFKLLPENELDALVHYVRYLSMRGEVERSLVDYAAEELDPADSLLALSGDAAKQAEQTAAIREVVSRVAESWRAAETQATPVPPPSEDRDPAEAVARGRELFYGALANCVKCHGDSALGDGQITDYDDWTKELEPTVPEIHEKYLALGDFVLPPRNIRPRNLRQGVFRGGHRPVDVYWRIRNGIDGTPMPGALMLPEDAQPGAKGLTEDDLWALVAYVRQLPYESINHAASAEVALQRERQ